MVGGVLVSQQYIDATWCVTTEATQCVVVYQTDLRGGGKRPSCLHQSAASLFEMPVSSSNSQSTCQSNQQWSCQWEVSWGDRTPVLNCTSMPRCRCKAGWPQRPSLSNTLTTTVNHTALNLWSLWYDIHLSRLPSANKDVACMQLSSLWRHTDIYLATTVKSFSLVAVAVAIQTHRERLSVLLHCCSCSRWIWQWSH